MANTHPTFQKQMSASWNWLLLRMGWFNSLIKRICGKKKHLLKFSHGAMYVHVICTFFFFFLTSSFDVYTNSTSWNAEFAALNHGTNFYLSRSPKYPCMYIHIHYNTQPPTHLQSSHLHLTLHTHTTHTYRNTNKADLFSPNHSSFRSFKKH